jgi:hypothetical protein
MWCFAWLLQQRASCAVVVVVVRCLSCAGRCRVEGCVWKGGARRVGGAWRAQGRDTGAAEMLPRSLQAGGPCCNTLSRQRREGSVMRSCDARYSCGVCLCAALSSPRSPAARLLPFMPPVCWWPPPSHTPGPAPQAVAGPAAAHNARAPLTRLSHFQSCTTTVVLERFRPPRCSHSLPVTACCLHTSPLQPPVSRGPESASRPSKFRRPQHTAGPGAASVDSQAPLTAAQTALRASQPPAAPSRASTCCSGVFAGPCCRARSRLPLIGTAARHYNALR